MSWSASTFAGTSSNGVAPGSNPFPGAVAGVYGPVADATAAVAELADKPVYAGEFDGAGNGWFSDGSGGATRLWMGQVADAASLPTPVSGESIVGYLTTTDEAGSTWAWVNAWFRITSPDVANAAALPTAAVTETFSDGTAGYPALRVKTLDTGVVYEWDGASWNATP